MNNIRLFKDFGVRALFGTLIIGAFAAIFIRFGLALPATLENFRAIGEIGIPIVTFVLGFYFGQRINTTTTNGGNGNNGKAQPVPDDAPPAVSGVP